MAHLPHIEMFIGEDQEIIWPCPKQLVWELSDSVDLPKLVQTAPKFSTRGGFNRETLENLVVVS